MRSLALCSWALALCLPANCQKGSLRADLLSLSSNSEGQVATHMMLMAEKTHEPSRSTVGQFARDLMRSRLAPVRASSPAPFPEGWVDAVVAEIDNVFKSAGTSTLAFRDHVGQFEKIMLTVGTSQANADKLAAELEIIGKQVRGPEDTPAR